MKLNPVGWFEIPVADMDRAKAFYEKALDIQIQVMDFGGAEGNRVGLHPKQ